MKKVKNLFIIIFLPLFLNAQFTIHNPDQSAYAARELAVGNNQVTALTKGDSVLCTYSGTNWSYYNMAMPFSSTLSNDLAIDNQGNYWMAYYNGAAKYDGSTLTEYNSTNSGIKLDFVNSIAFDNNNVGFFGHAANGISMLENNVWFHSPNFTGNLSILNNLKPMLMEYDEINDAIWIADFLGDFYKIENGVASQITSVNVPSISNDDVTDFTVTDDGTVWFSIADIGGSNGGLLSFDGTIWSHITSSNSSLPDDNITCITAIGNNLLIGAYGSKLISYYNGSAWFTYTDVNSNYPSSSPTLNEMKTLNNKAYVGTSNGVIEFDLNAPSAPTSIKAISDSEFSIFPNPTNGKLNINTTYFETKFDIQILDIRGKVVYMELIENNQTIINLKENNLIAGTYFLKIQTAKENYYSKVVLK